MLVFLFNKVADLRTTTLLEKGLQHRLFPVNTAKFLRATILNLQTAAFINTSLTTVTMIK